MKPMLLSIGAVVVLTLVIGTILSAIKPVTIADWGKALIAVGAVLFMLLVIGGAILSHYVHS